MNKQQLIEEIQSRKLAVMVCEKDEWWGKDCWSGSSWVSGSEPTHWAPITPDLLPIGRPASNPNQTMEEK